MKLFTVETENRVLAINLDLLICYEVLPEWSDGEVCGYELKLYFHAPNSGVDGSYSDIKKVCFPFKTMDQLNSALYVKDI